MGPRARATLVFLSLAQWRARADPEQEKVQTFIPMGLGWVSYLSIYLFTYLSIYIYVYIYIYMGMSHNTLYRGAYMGARNVCF